MRRTGPTNPETKKLAEELREAGRLNNAPIWGVLADKLTAPSRNKKVVNLSRICRNSAKGDTIVVPGKVLSSGDILHGATVAALSFSQEAARKIAAASGKTITIHELLKSNPKGSKVKVLV